MNEDTGFNAVPAEGGPCPRAAAVRTKADSGRDAPEVTPPKGAEHVYLKPNLCAPVGLRLPRRYLLCGPAESGSWPTSGPWNRDQEGWGHWRRGHPKRLGAGHPRASCFTKGSEILEILSCLTWLSCLWCFLPETLPLSETPLS